MQLRRWKVCLFESEVVRMFWTLGGASSFLQRNEMHGCVKRWNGCGWDTIWPRDDEGGRQWIDGNTSCVRILAKPI